MSVPSSGVKKAAPVDVGQLSFEALHRITRAIDVYSRALLRAHHLTGPQLGVLKALARHGQAPIGTLAKSTFLGAPTVTGVVDRLERQGWVKRIPSKEDRRQVLITMTAAGKRLLARDPPLLLDAFCGKLLRMPKTEQRHICEVLQQVAQMMEQSAISIESQQDLQTAIEE